VATFGKTSPSVGSSVSVPNNTDRLWATKYTLSEDGDVTQVSAFFDYDSTETSNSGDTGKAVIYADSGGSPGALVGVSSAVSIPAGDQQVDFPLTASLAAGDYWLGIVVDSFNSRVNRAATGYSSIRKEGLSYASPADPMGTPDATGVIGVSVFATYTPSAAVALDQTHYRFRNDDGSETTATWAAAEDTPISLAKNTPVRLRVEIGATGDPASAAYKLQYRKVGDSTWRDIN